VPESPSILAPFKAWLAVAIVVGVFVLPLWRLRPRGWPPQRRRALAWGGAHVAAAFLVFWFMPALIYPFVDPDALGRLFFGDGADPQAGKILSLALAGTLALPFQLLAWRGLLATVDPPSPPTLTKRTTVRDIRIGYLTWLLITPVVYLVGWVALIVNSWVGGHSEQHPLLKLFEPGTAPPGVLLLLLAEAVIAAPIREELLFRGILLPWLADRPRASQIGLMAAAIVGVSLRSPLIPDWSDPAAIAGKLAPAILVLALLPTMMICESWAQMRRWLPLRDPEARANAVRAIVASSAIFACVHSNVWPTPIPLAVLALALGWLAVRTQGIVAPILVHILFNAVAMCGEILFK
jgi:membrane protease YdiL (CAAX protease family)